MKEKVESIEERFAKIRELAEKGLQEKLYTSCAVGIGKGEFFLEHYVECDEKSLFDIASLTKPIAGTTLTIALKINERRLVEFLPQDVEDIEEKRKIYVPDVLRHRAGFCAHAPLYLEGKREKVMEKAWEMKLCYKVNEKCVYSDIGFICLTYFVEKFSGKKVNELFERIKMEIGLENTFFFPDIPENSHVVPTSDEKRVHDENSHVMGGVSLHAGLFSTLKDIGKFCRIVLKKLSEKPEIKRKVMEIAKGKKPEDEREFFLGFELFQVNEEFFLGHLGFTGCGFWIDLKKGRYCVFLSNRVYPSVGKFAEPAPPKFVELRRKIWRTALLEKTEEK